MTRSDTGVRALALLAAGCLAAVLAPQPAAADYALNTATKIVFTSIETPGIIVPDTPGAPDIFVTADRDFSTTAQFQNDAGDPAPASILLPVTVELYADSANGTRTLLATKEVPADTTEVTFTGLRLPSQNDVTLHMRAYNGIDVLFPGIQGDSPAFDVQDGVVVAPSDSNPTGIGGGGGQGNDTSCTPTVLDPICGDLVLDKPNGVQSNQLGSVGKCIKDETVDECLTDEYIQALVKLDPAVYNRSFPMKMVMKCHPSACDELALVDSHHGDKKGGGHDGTNPGVGHGSGVENLKLVASTLPDGLLAVSQPCTKSGKVPSSLPFCTDYAASFRAADGVWHLVWLSPGDARVSFP